MAANTVRKFVQQIAFGVDTTIGIGTYAALTMLFGVPFNWWYFAFAGFCAYLPDLDFTYFIFQSPEVKKWGHWRLGFHHPILCLPLVGVGVWYGSKQIAPDDAVFLTTLALVCVFGHFVHDSTKVGLHWFSPITKDLKISFDPLRWLNLRVTRFGIKIVPQYEVERRYAETARKSKGASTGDEISSRLEPVTQEQITWLTLTTLLLLMVMFSS